MKQKRVIRAFKSEAEQAEWWHKNRARLDQDLVDAAKVRGAEKWGQTTNFA